MTIREYFDNMMTADFDLEEIAELEETTFRCYEEDEDDFTMWAVENGIDLDAVDPATGELVFTLWCWDVCGD